MKIIVYTIIFIALMAGVYQVGKGAVYAIVHATDRREKALCELWKEEMKIYREYKIQNWQIDQCKAHGITL